MRHERYKRLNEAGNKANKIPKPRQEISSKQGWGRNNSSTGLIRNSEGPIVVMNWGNAQGAKGPYYYNSFQLRRWSD